MYILFGDFRSTFTFHCQHINLCREHRYEGRLQVTSQIPLSITSDLRVTS